MNAGVVKSLASLLADPKGMHASVDAFLPLCAHIGPTQEEDTRELLKEFCFEIEACFSLKSGSFPKYLSTSLNISKHVGLN